MAIKTSNIVSNVANDFFFPNLFEIIIDYVHLAPLWSGSVICHWQMQFYKEIRFTRLTNNPVEGYFNHLKNHLVPKNAMPSQLIGAIYEMLQMKFFLHYYVDECLKKKPPHLPEKLEKWQKRQISKREKGFYYKNFPSFGNVQDVSNFNTDSDLTANLDPYQG